MPPPPIATLGFFPLNYGKGLAPVDVRFVALPLACVRRLRGAGSTDGDVRACGSLKKLRGQ